MDVHERNIRSKIRGIDITMGYLWIAVKERIDEHSGL
jgi:hypothetical protein